MKSRVFNVKLLLLGLLVMGLSGCASLSEEECKVADWQDIGRRDGEKGEKTDRFYNHVKACSEYGIKPDRNLYNQGRETGLKAYCTPDNGRRMGESGRSYGRVCPKGLERGFLAQYKIGKKIYGLKSEIRSLSNEIARVEKSMDDPKTNRVDQVKLRYKFKELTKKKSDKERDLALAENQSPAPITGNSGGNSYRSTPPSASDLAK